MMQTALIRLATRKDYPAINHIESQSFGETAWTEAEMLQVIRLHTNCTLVAENHIGVCGYLIYSEWKDTLFIESLAVLHKFRRTGIATRFVDGMKTRLHHGRKYIEAKSKENNLDYQLFLKSQGFLCVEAKDEVFDFMFTEGLCVSVPGKRF